MAKKNILFATGTGDSLTDGSWTEAIYGAAQAFGELTRTIYASAKALNQVDKVAQTVKKTTKRVLAEFDHIVRLGSATEIIQTETIVTEADTLQQAAKKVQEVLTQTFSRYGEMIQGVTQSLSYTGDGTLLSMVNGLCGALGAVAVNGDLATVKTTLLQSAFTKVTEAVKHLTTQTDFLKNPIGTIATAIGGLGEKLSGAVQGFMGMRGASVGAWEAIKGVWGTAGTWLSEKLTVPVSDGFKTTVNGVIGFVNSLIRAVVSGVNAVLGVMNKLSVKVPDWVPLIGGKSIGFPAGNLKAPQIPYLAQGAVLPANKPFLAMVGDQRHGTNVEAPLATIQEAVAQVMGDHTEAMMAGLSASVQVQKEILEAVLGIHIGDSVIADAAQRYARKMAVVRGGAV